MRIEVHEKPGAPLFSVRVDTGDPPTVVRGGPRSPAVTLDWERALDDERRLRKCPVCGWPRLYAQRPMPRVTAFVLLLAVAAAVMLVFDFRLAAWVVGLLVLVAGLDLAARAARQTLVCYRCGSRYRGIPVAKGHPGWDAALAQQAGQAGPPPSHPRITSE